MAACRFVADRRVRAEWRRGHGRARSATTGSGPPIELGKQRMTRDRKAADYTLSGLRPLPVAVTTGGIVPEAPRGTIGLTTYNLTHDMVVWSGVFATHLPAA